MDPIACLISTCSTSRLTTRRLKQRSRPIYLEDGKWGPAYIHALWYATVEKRPTSQFVHLKPGTRPPAGGVVISSAESCQRCETITRAGVYHVYKAL